MISPKGFAVLPEIHTYEEEIPRQWNKMQDLRDLRTEQRYFVWSTHQRHKEDPLRGNKLCVKFDYVVFRKLHMETDLSRFHLYA